MNKQATATIILGNQLFPPVHLNNLSDRLILMVEEKESFSRYRCHTHKIILFLAAMRAHAEELKKRGAHVIYRELTVENQELSLEDHLLTFCREYEVSRLLAFEVEEKYLENRLSAFCEKFGLEIHFLPTPMFLCSRDDFSHYLETHNRPFLKSFYEEFRQKTCFLMDDSGKPQGGKFSYDTQNRKKLPKLDAPPSVRQIDHNKHVAAVSKLCGELFSHHPGNTDSFWLPVTRAQSLQWLRDFLKERFHHFGDYQDAITSRSDIVYHSALSPLLNVGLITPAEVVERAIEYAAEYDVPLNSVEGFVRQIIGWREFVRGIYRHYSEEQETTNFWGHRSSLGACWYSTETGIPPLDDALKKALQLGYNHHIERLMLISNIMLLSEIDPQEVYRWFMEMYVDSADWVMGPNVYGMGQFSDGGIFATKPYICASNYILKMSDYERGDWCDILDGLYWSFVEKHKDFYKKNPRTAAMMGNLNRIDGQRKKRIHKAAAEFRKYSRRT